MSLPLEVGLPMFRQPPGMNDDPLPEVASPSPSPSPRAEETPAPAPDSRPATPTADGDEWSERPPPLPDPDRPTRTSWVGRGHGAGDPAKVAKMLAGWLAIGLTGISALLLRRGRWLRHPSTEQMRDFTQPLARVAVRYLPLDVVGPTLADITEAAAAGHAYVMDGPLTGPITAPPITSDEETA